MGLGFVLLAISNAAMAQGYTGTSNDIHVINNDRTDVPTGYELRRLTHVWNITNGGDGSFYLHYTNGNAGEFTNQSNYYQFSSTSFTANRGQMNLNATTSNQLYAELSLRAYGYGYSNRFAVAQASNGDGVIYNRANGKAIEFGTNGTGRMWLAANGNLGIGNSSPGAKLTVTGTIRAAKETNEANYIEMDHGGSNSFLNHVGSGNMDFRFDGNNKMQISSNGRVGIGGDFDPTHTLDVRGTGNFTGDVTLGGAFNANGTSQFNNAVTIGGALNTTGLVTLAGDVVATGASQFNNTVTVGAQGATQNLEVYGRAKVMELEIKPTGNWADFVFEEGYRLRPLEEVAAYIDANHHLPEVPTTAEVREQGYLQTELNATLLQKVEELTLYMIELKADNEQLRAEVAELKGQMTDRQ